MVIPAVGLEFPLPTKWWRYNQDVFHIAFNPIFHEQTKQIEIDCQFTFEKIKKKKLIPIGYAKTTDQLRDTFKKALNVAWVNYIHNKLNMTRVL